MALRILAALSLCLCFAAIPSSVSALPDLKFPLQGASYCLALDVCSATVEARGTKQWLDCVASHALRDPPNRALGPLQKAEPPAAILMECGGVGWGNRFRALQVSMSLALISGLSMAYLDPVDSSGGDTLLMRMFTPPNGSTSWSHGIKSHSEQQAAFEYAKTGFSHGPMGMWRDEHLLKQMDTWDENHRVLFAMTCGGVTDFYVGSDCIKELLPIDRCQIYHTLPNIPFYGATFSRGTPRLSSLIARIRERVGVVVSPSEERWVGANGLRAKDKFVLAFHYRRPSEKTEGGQSIPIAQGWVGAETDGNHDTWRRMLAVAAEAKAAAVSQKKQFVLYFATDFEDFRPLVTRLLSNITSPLFGLHSEEVGHIVYGSNEQADFSFAEWWVLAQADWLVMLYPSSYSTTAAEVGFSTSGAMQRFDYVQSTFLRSQYAPECFGDATPATSEL